jgi:hypothetical protein
MTAQIHADLDRMLQTAYPHIKLCGSGEHGKYMLSPTEHLQLVHREDHMCIALTLRRPLHDNVVSAVEEVEKYRINFKLKLLNGSQVSCFQYGEKTKRSSGANVNIRIHIPASELSMALAAAVVETVLCVI